MDTQNPKSTAKIAGHPIHPMLVPLPIGFLVGAFLTDIAYWTSGWASFAYFSSWLIGAGIVTALLAAVAGFVDFLGEPRIRAIRKSWFHLFGNLAAVALSVVNFIVHLRDGAAAVLPTGIVLSGVVTLLLLINGWMGGELVFRGRVGVLDPEPDRSR
jgi:uncharacterized membrane protein